MSSWSERLARARPHLALAPAAVIAAIAAVEIVCVARAGSDVPTEADWRAASAYVAEHRRPGELIAVAPGWLDPVLRQHLGERIGLEMAARADDATYEIVWELSARGARAPETAGRERLDARTFGALSVSRWRRPPSRVVTDLVAEAGWAWINHIDNGAAIAAAAATRGAVRGRSPAPIAPALAAVAASVASREVWLVSLEEVGFEPRRCIRVTPPPNRTTSLYFASVPLGTELVGYVGLGDIFTRRDVRDPGRLGLRIDDREVDEVTAGVDDGWVRFGAATEPGAGSVELRATAVGPKARNRRICVAVEARAEAGGPEAREAAP